LLVRKFFLEVKIEYITENFSTKSDKKPAERVSNYIRITKVTKQEGTKGQDSPLHINTQTR